ncbi:MAG: hypothetical protein L0Y55_21840, partial [Anaerolineales bacterium]|nr:hypothetical protein [Anaerolineales bacterium]
YLADATGKLIYTRADWSSPVALIISNEAEGASAAARRIATATLSIPMPGSAESLNAAVAAGILLFEQVRPVGRINSPQRMAKPASAGLILFDADPLLIRRRSNSLCVAAISNRPPRCCDF